MWKEIFLPKDVLRTKKTWLFLSIRQPDSLHETRRGVLPKPYFFTCIDHAPLTLFLMAIIDQQLESLQLFLFVADHGPTVRFQTL